MVMMDTKQVNLRGLEHRAGLTLVEILISTTLSLLLILAIAQSFATVSDTISQGRARLEMAERMRGTVLRLTADLDSVSVPTLPWNEPSAGAGYFEVIEGWSRDYDTDANNVPDWAQPLPLPPALPVDPAFGDWDDILAMTVVNQTTPFVGYVMGTLTASPGGRIGKFLLTFDPNNPRARTKIISNSAEVIWWTSFNDLDNDNTRDTNENILTLHRRVLLVRPDIEISPSLSVNSMPPDFFFWGNDLSVAVDTTTGARVANSLQDLSSRHRRTAHVGARVTYPLDRLLLRPQRNVWLPGPDNAWGVSGVDDDNDGVMDGQDIDEAGAIESDDILIAENAGQDVILPNVLAFDVKVYDPLAPLKASPNGIDMLGPGDPRYALLNTSPSAVGEYVDLGYSLAPGGITPGFPIPFASAFSGPPRWRVGQIAYPSPTWDTWPTIYETDGADQDELNANPALNLIDEGFDGLDNDGINGVDDIDERETTPPYLSPLRGVKVIIRTIDPSSRQIRQEHVIANFKPS
jgi:hypothetical protein